MGTWTRIAIFITCICSALNDAQLNGQGSLRLSRRSLRLSQESPFVVEFGTRESGDQLRLSKKNSDDMLRLSRSSLPKKIMEVHSGSLRLSKRSTADLNHNEPLVIRLSERQLGQLLLIKRGTRIRDLRLSK